MAAKFTRDCRWLMPDGVVRTFAPGDTVPENIEADVVIAGYAEAVVEEEAPKAKSKKAAPADGGAE